MSPRGTAAALAVGAALCAGAASAADAGPYHRGGYLPASQRTSVHPLFDQPLRHVSICRGADGAYYLTGTLPGPRGDFQDNEGVRLWRSGDLKDWRPVGLVWEIETDGQRSGKSAWQLERRLSPDDPAGPLVRGITAPEVHHLKETFWITYSMNGHGTGLLKSTTGRADGPYEDLGRITARGGDASLFADEDGSVYWLWGEGWIAKMTPDMTALAGPPRCLLLDLSVCLDPPHPHDEPLRPHGPFLCRTGTRYVLTFSAGSCRLGQYVQDTFAVPADSVLGPYRNPMGHRNDLTLIGHNGQTTVFADGGGDLKATFWGADDRAVFRDRAGIVPLEPAGGTLRTPQHNHFTDRGPWAEIEPLVRDVQMNDTQLLCAPDGWYYLTGSVWVHSPSDARYAGLRAWRSRELTPHDKGNWETMKPVWTMQDVRGDPKWPAEKLQGRSSPVFWNAEVHWLKDTFWWFANVSQSEHGRSGSMLIRSTTGKAEGPYESLGRWIGSAQTLFRDDDGAVYMYTGGAGYGGMARLTDDLTAVDMAYMKKAAGERGLPLGHAGFLPCMTREGLVNDFDIGGCVVKIGGRYVLWCCNCIGGYDYQYKVSDSIFGPWSRPRVGVPYGGHGWVFRDRRGRWQGLFWLHAFHMRPALQELHVEPRGEDVLILPAWQHEHRARAKEAGR